MIATQPANQWFSAQFWAYIVIQFALEEDPDKLGQGDRDWEIIVGIMRRMLNDSCPAGNA
jgi:hypothetical protein